MSSAPLDKIRVYLQILTELTDSLDSLNAEKDVLKMTDDELLIYSCKLQEKLSSMNSYVYMLNEYIDAGTTDICTRIASHRHAMLIKKNKKSEVKQESGKEAKKESETLSEYDMINMFSGSKKNFC